MSVSRVNKFTDTYLFLRPPHGGKSVFGNEYQTKMEQREYLFRGLTGRGRMMENWWKAFRRVMLGMCRRTEDCPYGVILTRSIRSPKGR